MRRQDFPHFPPGYFTNRSGSLLLPCLVADYITEPEHSSLLKMWDCTLFYQIYSSRTNLRYCQGFLPHAVLQSDEIQTPQPWIMEMRNVTTLFPVPPRALAVGYRYRHPSPLKYNNSVLPSPVPRDPVPYRIKPRLSWAGKSAWVAHLLSR